MLRPRSPGPRPDGRGGRAALTRPTHRHGYGRRRTSAGRTRPRWRCALPALALAGILLLDLAQNSREWSLVPLAALDEPAHLLTAWLVLAAGVRSTRRPLLPWVLAGAVLLDLDHVPLYLGADIAVSPGGRPVSHSLLTVVVLLVAAAGVRRWRVPLAGLALGVATQLLRDLSTGPGVPLLWPALAEDVLLPYLPYALVLVALAAAATARRLRDRAARAAATA